MDQNSSRYKLHTSVEWLRFTAAETLKVYIFAYLLRFNKHHIDIDTAIFCR